MRAVNLIPAEQRKGAGGAGGRSEGAAFVVLGLLAGLVVLAGIYALSDKQVADRRAEAARLSAQAQTAQTQASALASYTSFLSLRDQRVSTVQQLAGSRFDWAHAFHELGRVLPTDVSLASVHGTMSAAATGTTTAAAPATPAAAATPTSSTPPGSTPSLAISGCTVSQAEVAYTLTRLRLMDGVGTVSLQSSSEAGAGATAPGGAKCPVNFSVTVNYAALPGVSGSAPAATAPAAATAAAPPAGTATATPAAATTGGK